jgi:hypothetical protein
MFYNGNEALTHNCLFNFVVGNRGAGKTFWSKEWAIKDFLKTGAQFIYVRRYKEEFAKGKKDKFFDDIEEKFPDNEFKVKGFTAYIDGKPCGQFMALSTSKIEKSTAFPKVNKIIFDEFILDKGFYHYIPDEVTNFLELYETVARTRDNVRVFFLSNAISITNPYFLYWKIIPNLKKRFTKPINDMLVELVQNEEFIQMKKQTRFGKLINGTKYGEYAIDNKFLRDNDTFIAKKTEKSKHSFTLKYNGASYGVWIDYSMGKYFISKNIDEYCKIIFSITLDVHTPNTMLLKGGQSVILKNFINQYKLGNVYYESMNIKNVVYEIIRLSLL